MYHSIKQAKSTNPIDSRYAHSAVLGINNLFDNLCFYNTYIPILYKAPEGRIIIYGGGKKLITIEAYFTKVTPDLVVLNTQTTPFEWTIPKVSSNIGEIPSLTGHTANLVDNYMIVAFGIDSHINNFCFNLKAFVLIGEILLNYRWYCRNSIKSFHSI